MPTLRKRRENRADVATSLEPYLIVLCIWFLFFTLKLKFGFEMLPCKI